MFTLFTAIWMSVAMAEVIPDQRAYANVDFPRTQAGRPRVVYETIGIKGFLIARTELGIFRIYPGSENGRRRADAVLPSSDGQIISMKRENEREIICGLGYNKFFTVDVTVADPLKTFRMKYRSDDQSL